jgi:hypothetical protein
MRLFARVALCVLAGLPRVCSAVTLSVDPAFQTMAPGAVAPVRVGITGLGDMIAPSLSAFDFQLSYDPSVLELALVTHGDPIYGNQLNLSGFGTITLDDTVTPGVARLMELSFDWPDDLNQMQLGRFVLANLFFRGIGAGTSPLILAVNTLGNEVGDSIQASVVNGSITVSDRTPVPEPGVFFLCGSGLFCAAMLGHHRRRKHS